MTRQPHLHSSTFSRRDVVPTVIQTLETENAWIAAPQKLGFLSNSKAANHRLGGRHYLAKTPKISALADKSWKFTLAFVPCKR
jgi:hypothetical protein